MDKTITYPQQKILDAFGALEKPILLPGGQGTTFRAGSIILKPISNSEEYAWIAENMNTIQQEGFRVAQHLKTKDGEWIHAGWGATEFIDGKEEKDHWEEKINVSRKFHKMLAR